MLPFIAIGVLVALIVAGLVFGSRETMAMFVRVAEAAGATDLDRSYLTQELYCRWQGRSTILSIGRETRYDPVMLCLDVQVMPAPSVSLDDGGVRIVDDQLKVRLYDREPNQREAAFRRAFELAASVIEKHALRRIDGP